MLPIAAWLRSGDHRSRWVAQHILARHLHTCDLSPPSKLKSLGCSLQCCKSIMSGNYPSSALRHGQVHKTTNSVDRQAVANIIRGKYLLRYWNYSCQHAVSKIEVVAKCIMFCSLMSSQAAPQKCSELLTANLVMDGQNLSEVEV